MRTLLPTLLIALTLPAAGCPTQGADDSASETPDTADDTEDTALIGYQVSVSWPEGSTTVGLGGFEPVDWEGSLAVSLPHILTQAGISDPQPYLYSFTASDGYSRDGFTADQVQQGLLLQDNGDLKWPEEMGLFGEDYVDGVVEILAE